MYVRFGKEFDINTWNVIGDFQYGPGWFLDAEQRARFDIFEVKPTARPSVGPTQKLIHNGFIQDAEGWKESWKIVDKSPEELAEDARTLASLKVDLMDQIDNMVEAIYHKWLRFDLEYYTREEKAKEYIDANYVGEPSLWITSYADAVQLPYDEAADQIVEQGDVARAVMELVAAQRMRRYVIERATTIEEAQQEYVEIVQNIQEATSQL